MTTSKPSFNSSTASLVFQTVKGDVSPTGQEVMIDRCRITWKRSATMRALGKCRRTSEPIVGRQIHAHHPHLGFAFQALKIGLQRQLPPAQDHVIDLVISQVTQRGGEAERRVKKCSSMPSTCGQRAECHSPNWRLRPR